MTTTPESLPRSLKHLSDFAQRPGVFDAVTALVILVFLLAPVFMSAQLHGWIGQMETGDVAANSLLVQQLKDDGYLLHGNYSRVEVYHPGPFFFLFLAGGEVVFHDTLHLVSTPMAGQVIGATVCVALFIFGVYLCLVPLFGRGMALGAALLIVALANLIDHRLIASVWFPHVYGPPYAALLASSAAIFAGHRIGLPVLAASCVALVHGHVSFVLIAAFPVVFLGALWALRIIHIDRPKRYLIGAISIAAAGALPILANTIFQFPGEIGTYLVYGSGESIGVGFKAASEMIAKAAVMPSSLYPWLLLLALCFALLFARHQTRLLAGLLSVVAVCLLAVHLYIAKFSDTLDPYVVIFTMWTPPVIVAVSLAALASAAPLHRGIYVAGGVATAVFATAVCSKEYFLPTAPRASEVAAREALLEAAGGKAVQVMISREPSDWAPNWFSVLAVILEDARAGRSEICVDPSGWHPSFTRARKCDAPRFSGRGMFVVYPASGDMPEAYRLVAQDQYTRYWVLN